MCDLFHAGPLSEYFQSKRFRFGYITHRCNKAQLVLPPASHHETWLRETQHQKELQGIHNRTYRDGRDVSGGIFLLENLGTDAIACAISDAYDSSGD